MANTLAAILFGLVIFGIGVWLFYWYKREAPDEFFPDSWKPWPWRFRYVFLALGLVGGIWIGYTMYQVLPGRSGADIDLGPILSRLDVIDETLRTNRPTNVFSFPTEDMPDLVFHTELPSHRNEASVIVWNDSP